MLDDLETPTAAAGDRASTGGGGGPSAAGDAGNVPAAEQAPLPEERLAFALSDGRVGVLGVCGRHVSPSCPPSAARPLPTCRWRDVAPGVSNLLFSDRSDACEAGK